MKKILVVFLIPILFSCKKDKTCNQDMAGIAGTYKVTAVGYKANASAQEEDRYNYFFSDACERDDLFAFHANGTFTFTDAGVKCVPPGDYSGTWSLNGSTMTIDGDLATIQSFNCSALVITGTGVLTPGDQIRVTYTRQ